jgi:hypothetical protein
VALSHLGVKIVDQTSFEKNVAKIEGLEPKEQVR